jgi:GAF domain-containing protein
MTTTLDDEVIALRRANADLRGRLDEALAERDEREAQKAAMAEILEVINASPGDLASVFDAILEKAMRLCDAAFGTLRTTQDGEHFDLAALRRVPPALAEYLERAPPTIGSGRGPARILEGERVVHVLDAAADDTYRSGPPGRRALVDLGGARTVLSVGMRKDDVVLGVITIYRQEVRPFSDKQIALLQNFAAQAVIAMENARLITETHEALEQQTATTEVLQVINSSPGDLAPVLKSILEKSARLCSAESGIFWVYQGHGFRPAAWHGVTEEFSRFLHERSNIWATQFLDLIEGGETFTHTMDLAETHTATTNLLSRAVVDLEHARTGLLVPLRKDELLIGAIRLYRHEVRPFSDKQVALLQNFAAQAVIAMENARLITETREALEQQTATAEVLQVINSSPGDLSPVFDAMLEKATHLCEAEIGVLWTYHDEQMEASAILGAPPRYAEFLRQGPRPLSPTHERLRQGERVIQIADVPSYEGYRAGLPLARALFDLGGVRTILMVPLRKDEAVLGAFAVYRQQVRPFSDKQIALLENFAAQAVIAMENARLITETREALEQQTATAEVLQVINSSPGDLAPVFDVILEKAIRLCGGLYGIFWTIEGERARLVASRNMAPDVVESLRQQGESGNHPMLQRIIGGEHLFQFDLPHHDVYRLGQVTAAPAVVAAGVRRLIWLALVRDGTAIGTFAISRREAQPFTDKQIALLQNFAAQAVIAMENARLITETREALEQQTATAEVLQVINSSPGDLIPVFDAILDKAHSLCDSGHGTLFLRDGDYFRPAAMRGVPAPIAERLRSSFLGADAPLFRPLLAGERFVHIVDLAQVDHPMIRVAIESGVRTLLSIPLRKGVEVFGMIVAARFDARPFTDNQIGLLQNFAAQAVIAMENARLLTETREALEQQTATAEVLQVINSSPDDLAPVFDAMLEKAMRLCGADFGVMNRYDGKHFYHAADNGVPSAYARYRRERGPISYGSGTTPARLVAGENLIHTADLMATEAYERGEPARRALVDLGGARTHLTAALRKGDVLLGDLSIYRQEVRPFTDKQIALLQNFAAQAVVAMENARLLTETREALEQQTATSEVLQVINSSPGDLGPVFDAMLEKATRLCDAAFGLMSTYDGERYHTVATRGVGPKLPEFLRAPPHPDPDSALGRIERGEDLVLFDDIADTEVYRKGDPRVRAVVDLGGAHNYVMVALRKDEKLLGVIAVYRREIRPFSGKQVALLQNFAAQAVIAMENARLLDEIRQRQSELRVTFDNMADGVVMFDEDLRLAAWNRNFQELLDLPDAVLVERPSYAHYLRILAERGEFGTEDVEAELSRRLEHTDQELRLERTRPDGRVIEVRRNAVAGGGFVLIYSDITERKRSEAEIRAARDAAEAAYRHLKAAQASLIQAEKMASLGQLTAGIAHEIKNPLNFVNNFAGLSVELLDELKETAAPVITALDDDKRAEIDETIDMLTGNLEKIAEHGKRADNIVKGMLEHSRGSSGERRSVDLNGLIEEALNLAYHGARAQDQTFNITLERDYADAMLAIELVPQDITRVCLNLFSNGFYAASKRQNEQGDLKFTPTLKVSTRYLGDAVEIRVRDNGIGIPPEIKDKLFQPFFTTKPTGEGTGLGLSISYDIVTQQHGGTITVDSRVGEFTEFTVRLPRTHRATMAEAAS